MRRIFHSAVLAFLSLLLTPSIGICGVIESVEIVSRAYSRISGISGFSSLAERDRNNAWLNKRFVGRNLSEVDAFFSKIKPDEDGVLLERRTYPARSYVIFSMGARTDGSLAVCSTQFVIDSKDVVKSVTLYWDFLSSASSSRESGHKN